MNSSIQQTIADNPLRPLGRFSRLSYLGWSFLMNLIFFVAIGIPILILANSFDPDAFAKYTVLFMLICGLTGLILLYLSIVFLIRRLHDCNRSAWLGLLIIVPVINLFFILYLLCAKGTEGPNNFGPVRETRGWEKVLGSIYAILFPLGLILNILMSIASMSAPH
nr:DUF805 domain-containing protein [uncultured Acinetobacter sp.]